MKRENYGRKKDSNKEVSVIFVRKKKEESEQMPQHNEI